MLTMKIRPPKTRNWLTWSTSVVTRETRAPRRSVFCVSSGQVVDVAERLDPQGGEAALGGAEQPAGHEVGGDAGQRDAHAADQPDQDHEGDVGTAVGPEPLVEGLLDGDRHDHLAEGGDDRAAAG